MKKRNQRYLDSIAAHFKEEDADFYFYLSPSDMGVRRNLGRAGARFGADCILTQFKKMNYHFDGLSFAQAIVSDQKSEMNDFHLAQDKEKESLKRNLINTKPFIHLGGGHDHIYPLLSALDESGKYKKIAVINLDAHLDTRVDDKRHSGTPFRDFDQVAKCDFFLYQYGIHDFANSKSTQSQLANNKMYISALWPDKFTAKDFIQELKEQCPFTLDEDCLLILSLDCDALHSSIMSAVSAVNHNGLSLTHCVEIMQALKTLKTQTQFAIYEYNPLFDDLATSSARAITYLIQQYLKIFIN